MRVLIAGLRSATEPSGICRTIANLVRGLRENDASIEIVLAIGSWQRIYFEKVFGALPARLHIANIRNSAVSRNAWYLFALPSLAEEIRADVVHLSYPAPVMRSLFRAAVITTVHDLYAFDCPENFGFPRVMGNRLAWRRALAASDRVACVSERTLLRVRRQFPKVCQKAMRIENAVALTPSCSNAQCSIEEPFLLAVGQHRANKRLDLLLQACHLWEITGGPRYRIVIVGASGPETAKLHALSRELSLEHRTYFLSNLPDAVLAELYRRCDLFVTLSSLEGYGLPLGEALSAGARVLASDIPAHRAIGGDLPVYVKFGGPNELEQIVAAMQHAVASRCPTRPVQLPSIHETAAQYFALYRDALRHKAGQPEQCPLPSSSMELR